MTAQDPPNVEQRAVWTTAFHAAYVVAAVVATLGWIWLLGYLALMLFGY